MTKAPMVCLVYQAGIANVFEIKALLPSPIAGKVFANHPYRLMQASFKEAEWFCRGLAHAGRKVRPYSANFAGDIAEQPWTEGLEDCPFRDAARPVSAN